MTSVKKCKIEISVETQKPTTISLACSKCGKTLSYEDAYLVNTGQKVKKLALPESGPFSVLLPNLPPDERTIEFEE